VQIFPICTSKHKQFYHQQATVPWSRRVGPKFDSLQLSQQTGMSNWAQQPETTTE